MKKILITIIPFVLGMLIAFLIELPKDGFYIKDMNSSKHLIFITNFIICLIILYGNRIIANIIYIYNLIFMGIVVYIMLFIMNTTIYYHAPFEIFTFVYTYVYARDKKKIFQIFIIMTMILISALIEGSLIYV